MTVGGNTGSLGRGVGVGVGVVAFEFSGVPLPVGDWSAEAVGENVKLDVCCSDEEVDVESLVLIASAAAVARSESGDFAKVGLLDAETLDFKVEVAKGDGSGEVCSEEDPLLGSTEPSSSGVAPLPRLRKPDKKDPCFAKPPFFLNPLSCLESEEEEEEEEPAEVGGDEIGEDPASEEDADADGDSGDDSVRGTIVGAEFEWAKLGLGSVGNFKSSELDICKAETDCGVSGAEVFIPAGAPIG